MNSVIEPPVKSKPDWFKAKVLYMEDSTISYSDLARMFGVSLKQVKKHGSKDGFARGRQEVADLAEYKIKENLVDARVEANDRHRITYKNTQALINKYLSIINQHIKQVEQKAKDEGRIVDPKELYCPEKLLCLTKALRIAVDGERVTLDLPTDIKTTTGQQAPITQLFQPPELIQDLLEALKVS